MRLHILMSLLSIATLSAGECTTKEDRLFFFADFLYWKGDNLGFSYAFNQTSESTTIPHKGKVIQIDSNWAPGFQIGLGLNTGHFGWDLTSKWTWYSNESKESHHRSVPSNSIGQGYYPIWPVARTLGGGTDLGPYTDVEAEWDLVLNAVDLSLSKNVLEISGISLALQLGARGAWIHQKFTDQFSNPIEHAPIYAVRKFGFKGKNDYWGVGPILGLDSKWNLGRGFHLVGKGATALLYGHTEVSNLSQELDPVIVHHDVKDEFNQMIPYSQILVGFQWGSSFRSNRCRFEIEACWETGCWWNQFNVPVAFEGYAASAPGVGNSPLTTEGVTFDLRLSY